MKPSSVVQPDSRWGQHAILLVRVSTQGQDVSPQISDLEAYAKSKGYTTLHQITTKESGLINYQNRKGTNELFTFLKANPEYKTVFCTEMSRLGRREADLHYIKEWFSSNKIQFYLKDKDFKLFDGDGLINADISFMFTIYGYFAETEIKLKKDRFARSKKSLAAEGYSISGKRLFGYDRVLADNKRNKYIINEIEAGNIRQIYSWYLNGIDNVIKNPSLRQITLECIKRGFPRYTHSKRNINKLVKEKAYTGFKTTNNKRKNPYHLDNPNEEEYITTNMDIKYPRILDDDTFDRVQNKLATKNTNADKSSKHTTLLSKLITCTSCGRYYQGEYRKVEGLNKNFYRCASTKNVNPCDNKQSIGMVLLDSALWCLIKNDLSWLSTEILKNNPLNEIENYKTEKENLLIKKQEIEDSISFENKRTQIISGRKNVDKMALLESFDATLKKYDRELDRIIKKIAEIDVSMNLFESGKKENYQKQIEDNLIVIEKDKGLLKKYINTYIKSIKIVHQDNRFSVVKIIYSIFAKEEFNIKLDGERQLYVFNYLLIDKRITNSIKIVKSNPYLTTFVTKTIHGKQRIHAIVTDAISILKNWHANADEGTYYQLQEIFDSPESTKAKLRKLTNNKSGIDDFFTPIIFEKLKIY